MEHVRRVGLIGDVHTEHRRLARAIDHLLALEVDRLLCVGDLADGPGDGPDVDLCVELLESADVLTVVGNHDRWLRDHEMRDLHDATDPDDIERGTGDYLDRLPQTIELATPAGAALLCHGVGSDDMAKLLPYDRGQELRHNAPLQALLKDDRYRYMLGGHTHKRMVRTIEGVTIINAGTLYTGHEPCCALVDFADLHVAFYDLEANVASLSERIPLG